MKDPITPTRLARLVRDARRSIALNQADFARILGKTQSVVSRYEDGSVEPPGSVVMHCIHILERGLDPPGPDGNMALGAVEEALAALQLAVRALHAPRPD
ncbi:MAG: helix-turn-helix domain-containing protein [Lysobacter sp.]|nr:MAG: helix-turn-helix domain-containing protein [Lysobacter sp.]